MKTTIYPLNQYADFDSAYWGMGNASNGKIYFGLCTHLPGKNAGLFSFGPKTDEIKQILDLGILATDQSHGKIHTPVLEGKRLYRLADSHTLRIVGKSVPVSSQSPLSAYSTSALTFFTTLKKAGCRNKS